MWYNKIMKYDFITIGGATEDITFYTSDGVLISNKKGKTRQKLIGFEYGQKMKVDKAHSTFGGGAANASVCLARLGFNVATIVSIGKDLRGKRVEDNFHKLKVSTSLIQKNKEKETGFSFLLVGQGNEHVVFSNRAANEELALTKKEVSAIKKSKWIYVSSLSGKWKGVLSALFAIPDIKIAWNPGHIQIHSGFKSLKKYLKKCEVLMVNKSEAIKMVSSDSNGKKKNGKNLGNTKNLLRLLKENGSSIVVITDGENGADAFDGENFYHQDIIKERRKVDTTGVGDVFGSTFAAGLEISKGDIEKAMLLGARNTASVVGEQGAQNGLLNKRQILK